MENAYTIVFNRKCIRVRITKTISMKEKVRAPDRKCYEGVSKMYMQGFQT